MELSVTACDATNLLVCGGIQQLFDVKNHRVDGEGVHEQTVHGVEHLCYDNNKNVAANTVSQPQGLLSAHRNSGKLNNDKNGNRSTTSFFSVIPWLRKFVADPYCALHTAWPAKSQITSVKSDLPSANRMTMLSLTSANRCSAIAMSRDWIKSAFDAGWSPVQGQETGSWVQ